MHLFSPPQNETPSVTPPLMVSCELFMLQPRRKQSNLIKIVRSQKLGSTLWSTNYFYIPKIGKQRSEPLPKAGNTRLGAKEAARNRLQAVPR